MKLHGFTRSPLLLCVLAALGTSACSPREPAPRPNIVLVISDDQGYADFGFMGSDTARTPRMDALAAEGVVFSHGFNTSSVSRASLQTLLTGLSPLRFDARAEQLWANRQARDGDEGEARAGRIIAEMETLPRLLSREGYASFHAGKHWEGTWRDGGFSAGTKEALHRPAQGSEEQQPAAAGGASPEPGRESLNDLWRFIDAERGDSPFFVWFAPFLRHGTDAAPEEYRALYTHDALSSSALEHFAHVSRMDARVGELLDGLAQRDLREDTLVVLLSDHGSQPHTGSEGHATRPAGGPRAGLSLDELGFRTPIVFAWPARLREPRRLDGLVSSEDVFSTILDILEVPAPRGRDGISLWPILRGAPGPHRRSVIASMPAGAFRRDHRWSFLWREPSGEVELYDVERDPEQSVDVSAQKPDVVDTFRNEISSWRRAQSRPL